MKPGDLFKKTMPFCMAKLALGGAMVLISVILLAILMGLGWLFGEGGMLVCLLIWLGAIGVIRFAIMHYVGYLVKAGHVAVLAEAVTTGEVPANQVQFGKNSVKERFATTNIYFAVDKLVSGAVKQIQRKIGQLENALSFIPGMDKIGSLAKFYVELSLGYIDECCLGYTVYRKDQGAFHSACDGVVIYAQNIGKLLKSSAMTMLKVLLFLAVIVLAAFVPVGIIFKLLNWSPLAAFLLALLIAWVVKFALVDSFILCQTMSAYMTAAQNTQITFDLYGMLSGISSDFKKLWEERQKEGGGQETYAAEGNGFGTVQGAYANPDAYSAQGSVPFAPVQQSAPVQQTVNQQTYGNQRYPYPTAQPAPNGYGQTAQNAPLVPDVQPQSVRTAAQNQDPFVPQQQAAQGQMVRRRSAAPAEQFTAQTDAPRAAQETASLVYQTPAYSQSAASSAAQTSSAGQQPVRRRRAGNAASVCPQCGASNAYGSRFCGGCGARLGDNSNMNA